MVVNTKWSKMFSADCLSAFIIIKVFSLTVIYQTKTIFPNLFTLSHLKSEKNLFVPYLPAIWNQKTSFLSNYGLE